MYTYITYTNLYYILGNFKKNCIVLSSIFFCWCRGKELERCASCIVQSCNPFKTFMSRTIAESFGKCTWKF